MKKVHWWIVVLAAAVGVCGGGAGTYWWLESADDLHAHDDREDDGPKNGREENTELEISDAELGEFQIEVALATSGEIHHEITVPGEVRLNPDAVAHIAPRVPGVVREVFKSLGDKVTSGELLAVLDSRELATAEAELLAGQKRLELAIANCDREKRLREKKLGTERQYLESEQAKAEAEIEIQSARQRLEALGVTETQMEALANAARGELTRYEMRAPRDGTIIGKHITRGEKLKDDVSAFVVADLATVWVNLTVYRKDLGAVRVGQTVTISAGHGIPDTEGTIDYLSPVIEEATRSASARVVLANGTGVWRPGLFVTGRVVVGTSHVAVAVPKSAVQTLEGRWVVFVRDDHGFEPRTVELGRSSGEQVEIVSGLKAGEHYVSAGAFTLKAELNKGSFEHAGHAH